jgi:hypothetical protein
MGPITAVVIQLNKEKKMPERREGITVSNIR